MVLLLGAALSWYIAAHAAAAALPKRASAFILGGGLPALAGVVWFALTGRTEAALALALGTAVASSTLVLGLVANAEPTEGRRVLDDPGRRLKAMLLPVAVTFLVAGFAGALSLLHGILLLAEGGIIAWLGLASRRAVPTATVAGGPVAEKPEPGGSWWLRGPVIVLAAILGTAGAGLAAGAASAASRRQGMELDAAFATLLVAAILALPLIGIGTRFSIFGQGLVAQRGLALLAVYMVCLAIPVATFIDIGRQASDRLAEGGAWLSLLRDPPSVPLPQRLWRADSIVLCLAGLLLLPPAAGRYRLGKLEGVGLIVLYLAFLFLTLVWSW